LGEKISFGAEKKTKAKKHFQIFSRQIDGEIKKKSCNKNGNMFPYLRLKSGETPDPEDLSGSGCGERLLVVMAGLVQRHRDWRRWLDRGLAAVPVYMEAQNVESFNNKVCNQYEQLTLKAYKLERSVIIKISIAISKNIDGKSH